MSQRVLAFAGANILYRLAGKNSIEVGGYDNRLLVTGAGLLAKGLGGVDDSDKVLINAVSWIES